MTTAQTVVTNARAALYDEDPDGTWPDAELLRRLNEGIRILRNKRPDLFVGSFAVPIVDLALGDTLTIDEAYHPALEDYIVARALMKQNEEGSPARAAAFFALFGEQT